MRRKWKEYPGIITNSLNNDITGKIETRFNSPMLASYFIFLEFGIYFFGPDSEASGRDDTPGACVEVVHFKLFRHSKLYELILKVRFFCQNHRGNAGSRFGNKNRVLNGIVP